MRRRNFLLLLAAAAALLLASCGGGASPPPPPPPVTISISPTSATLNLSTSQPFTATVTGTSNTSVTWQVNGIVGGNATIGTITNAGVYTSPNAIPSSPSVTVTAVSVANPAKSASATVNIGDPTINQASQPAPIKLGTSGGNEKDRTNSYCCSGTLGSLVVRAGTYYILSNNHVLARSGQATLGELIDQPGLVDTNCKVATTVANLSQFAPLQNGGVDAAIAQIVAGEVDTTGSILQLGAVSGGVPQPDPPANTIATAAVNMQVAKSGRSSGLSCGTVQATNLTVQVDYSSTCNGPTSQTITYNNQIGTSANFISAGDSGSLMVDATTAQPVALLFAGDNTGAAVGNPIQTVLNALKDAQNNVPTMVGGPEHQVSGCTGMAAQPAPIVLGTEQLRFQAALPNAIAIKERHESELMTDPAVLGVGIGAITTPGQPAIVVLVERGKVHRPISPALEGVPTRIMVTGRFKAWDRDATAPKRCSAVKTGGRSQNPGRSESF